MTKTLKAILTAGCASIAISYGAEATWRHNPYSLTEVYTIVSWDPNYSPAKHVTEDASRSGSASYVSREGVSPVSDEVDAYPYYAPYSVDYDPNCPYCTGMTAFSNYPQALPTYEQHRQSSLPSYADSQRAANVSSPLAEENSDNSNASVRSTSSDSNGYVSPLAAAFAKKKASE